MGESQPKRVTIAHLSDLHLTAKDGEPRYGSSRKTCRMNENLDRLLAQPRIREADIIAITGDVADRGHLAAWSRLWQACSGINKKRLVVIPGNHDVCCLGLVRTRTREEHVEIARTGLGLGKQPTRFPWVRTFFGRRLACFAVDSVNSGNFNLFDNATGATGFDQLAKLGRLLQKYADVPAKLILLHHSPNIPKRATSRRRKEKSIRFWERPAMQMNQLDRVGLRLLARSFGVKAILHGHTHDNLDRRVNSVRIIGTKDSTVVNDRGLLSYKTYVLYPETGKLCAKVWTLRGA